MKKEVRRKATLYIRDIPIDLKAQFKAYCAARGLTLRKAIVRFMREKVIKGK